MLVGEFATIIYRYIYRSFGLTWVRKYPSYTRLLFILFGFIRFCYIAATRIESHEKRDERYRRWCGCECRDVYAERVICQPARGARERKGAFAERPLHDIWSSILLRYTHTFYTLSLSLAYNRRLVLFRAVRVALQRRRRRAIRPSAYAHIAKHAIALSLYSWTFVTGFTRLHNISRLDPRS